MNPRDMTNPPLCLFCSEMSACLQASARVNFDSLLPPMANRGDAAHAMHQLLGEDSALGKTREAKLIYLNTHREMCMHTHSKYKYTYIYFIYLP